jgi:Sulfotransferase domain
MPPLKYLGVGLSRTGTSSLSAAMSRLGFKSLHWEPERLDGVILGTDNNPNFKIYDDCDFICDIPHAYFFREIRQAYPGLKFILTERNEEDWYRSIRRHFPDHARKNRENKLLKMIVYGTTFDENPEFLTKKRFRDWNDTIKHMLTGEKKKVSGTFIDAVEGGWYTGWLWEDHCE